MVRTAKESAMKLPRRSVTKANVAAILAASAALCWVIPEATAGLISGGQVLPNAVYTRFASGIGDASGRATASGQPFPSVEAFSEVQGFAAGETAVAAVRYWVQVDGPTPRAFVPLVMENTVNWFDVGLTSTTHFLAEALVEVGAPPGVPLDIKNGFLFQSGSTLPSGGGSSTTVVPIDAQTGVPFEVSIAATAEMYLPFGGPNTVFTAQADPVISFAPSFDSAGYTLEFSPGIGNGSAPAAPEPSTLVLSSIPLGIVGAIRAYRQGRRTRAAAWNRAHAAGNVLEVIR